MGLLNNSSLIARKGPQGSRYQLAAGMFKTVVQQGHSHFDGRSVHIVREHGKMARTPLVTFFNIPEMDRWLNALLTALHTSFFLQPAHDLPPGSIPRVTAV